MENRTNFTVLTQAAEIDPNEKKWQQFTLTDTGREVTADVTGGLMTMEIVSAYIAYDEGINSKPIEQYPTYISTITSLPAKNKQANIIGKEVVEGKVLATIEIVNVGLNENFFYNTIYLMCRNRDGEIKPFGVAAIKEVQLLSPTDFATQRKYELALLISTEAQITIQVNPNLEATRIIFNNSNTDLTSTNMQHAIAEVNTKINTHKDASILVGIHDLKFDEDRNVFQIYKDNSYQDIDLGGSSISNIGQNVIVIQGQVTSLEQKTQELETNLGNLTDTTNSISTKVTQLETNVNSVTEKANQNERNINTVTNDVTTHKELKVSSESGVHGIKFDEGTEELLITKQNGEQVPFTSGVNPDDLLVDFNTKLTEIITIVGEVV